MIQSHHQLSTKGDGHWAYDFKKCTHLEKDPKGVKTSKILASSMIYFNSQ
jgi:hypothetical protein